MKRFLDYDYSRLYDMSGVEIDLFYKHNNINDYIKSSIFEDYKECRQKLLDCRVALSKITTELESIDADPYLYFKNEAKSIYDSAYSNLKSVKVTKKKVELLIDDLTQRIEKETNDIIKDKYQFEKQFFINRHIYYEAMHDHYKKGMEKAKDILKHVENRGVTSIEIVIYIKDLAKERDNYINLIKQYEEEVEEYRKCVTNIDEIIK